MAKKKAGRKPIGKKPQSEVVIIGCEPHQKAKWKKAAARCKPPMSLSAWVRHQLDAAAS